MKNIFKLISITLVSLFVTFSFANASSGVFKISHDLGFGKDTNLDAITKGRLFQVVITSCGVKTDVGSSITNNFGFCKRQRIISTLWRSPTESSPTLFAGSRGRP